MEVDEGKIPPRISCLGNGYPKLQYQWLRNGTVKSEGSILQIYKPMTRDDAGTYECVSRNKHGNQIVAMNISILCKFFQIPSPFLSIQRTVFIYICAFSLSQCHLTHSIY